LSKIGFELDTCCKGTTIVFNAKVSLKSGLHIILVCGLLLDENIIWRLFLKLLLIENIFIALLFAHQKARKP
jgi:hypothetical protein